MSWTDAKRAELSAALAALDDRGLRRSLREVSSQQAARFVLQGREVVNFSSNNYLGLASSAALAQAGAEAGKRWGSSSGGSRLIVGNSSLHERLERELAELHGSGGALLFNSGYHANVGVISAIMGRGDTVFSDELNHASIIDGCRLSRANVVVYGHADMAGLEARLRDHSGDGRRLVVSDSVFSMDGDQAPLAELVALADKYEAWLMLDEAHAVGVLGPGGSGLASQLGLADRVDVRIGTLGKAVGSFGGYAVGSVELRELLLQRARSFVFTTALPASVVAASLAGVQQMRGDEGDSRRHALARNTQQLAAGLARLGLRGTASVESAIFPVLVGDASATMKACEGLLELGLYCQGIRPPTVPRGTSRLRVAVMATHSADDIEQLLAGLETMIAQGLLPAQ